MTGSPTIIDSFKEMVRRFPERPAVSDGARTLTYHELWREAEQYAAELGRQGSGGGCGSLVPAHASVSFAVAVIGTYLSERVFVPYAQKAPADDISCGPNIAEVLYTTGTTGVSKGVMISRHAAWASADGNRYFDRITEETVYLIASPLNHVSALRKLEACLLVGAHAVLLDGFLDVRRYYETIVKHRVNALLLPPAAVQLLLSVSRARFCALADQIKLVHSNGAPMTEATKAALRCCLPNARLVFAYGATEAGSVCCAYDYAEFPGKANCVGRASPHTRVSVKDGCLAVSGDTIMEGYLNDLGRTAEVLHDGWLYTHDLGHIDDEGFIYVVGRKDDVINCGGMKVSPTEVEEVAMCYPDILDCACIGVDDSFTGSAVKLFVVPRNARYFDLVAFRDFLKGQLERHQLPTQISYLVEIPRINGKIDGVRLRRIVER